MQPKFTRVEGADIAMQSCSLNLWSVVTYPGCGNSSVRSSRRGAGRIVGHREVGMGCLHRAKIGEPM